MHISLSGNPGEGRVRVLMISITVQRITGTLIPGFSRDTGRRSSSSREQVQPEAI
jgi:hypothetical protein